MLYRRAKYDDFVKDVKEHNKKLICFGAGEAALDFFSLFRQGLESHISCFVDNYKGGTEFSLGTYCYPVYSPDILKSENDIIILITSGYYNEIAIQLNHMSNLSKANIYISHLLISNQQYSGISSITETVENEVEKSKTEMLYYKNNINNYLKNVLLFGELIENKALVHTFNKTISRELNGFNFFYLAESDTQCEVNCPVILVPELFRRGYPINSLEIDIEIDKKIISSINNNPYLKKALDLTTARFSDASKGSAEYFVYLSYKYLSIYLDIFKPVAVIIWLEFYAFHIILNNICRERGIRVFFYEFGVLPGTYCLETDGQMGESLPAKNHIEFNNLYVNDNDLLEAKVVWDYLKNNKIGRRKLMPSNLLMSTDTIRQSLNDKHPVVLYAGQNDYESGIYPHDDFAKGYHSPIFSLSDEAAMFLANICKKNNWNFIYKLHPAVLFFDAQKQETTYPDNAIIIHHADIHELIDMSDVLVTITSQMGYMSLIRKKPALMLGYTQLRGKGCTYEAFEISQIESELVNAINMGFTSEQEKSFQKHIAQVLKYYVYDDLQDRPVRYGRTASECASYLMNNINV